MLLLLWYGLWADTLPRLTTYSSDDDDVTLLLAAQTDTQAFGLVYQRYIDDVFRYLEVLVANVEDAEDLSQQTLLKIYQIIPKLHANFATLPLRNGSIRGLLFHIAHNLAIDHLRKKRSTIAWQHLPEPLHPAAPGDLEADIIQQDQYRQLRCQLQYLSSDKQRLIALHYGTNLSARVIAEMLNKSHAAVAKMLQRVLQEVKRRYEI